MANALNDAIKKGRKISSMENALIEALGGSKWMQSNSSIVTTFSPNNVQMIAIAYDAVIVRRYINSDKRGLIICKKFNPKDKISKDFVLNKILENRKMSGLEELLLWEGYYEISNKYFDAERFKNVYTTNNLDNRLRTIAVYREIPTETIRTQYEKKKSVRYCASQFLEKNYGSEYIQTVYQPDTNTLAYAKRYRLDPTHYAMDVKNGPLEQAYKKIQSAVTQWKMVNECKKRIVNDIADYAYYDRLREYFVADPKNEAQTIIKEIMRTAKDKAPHFDTLPKQCVIQALDEIEKQNPSVLGNVGRERLLKMLNLFGASGTKYGKLSLKTFKQAGVPSKTGLFNIKGYLGYVVKEASEKIAKKGKDEKKLIDSLIGGFFETHDIMIKGVLDRITVEELLGMLDKLYNIKQEIPVDEEDEKSRRIKKMRMYYKEKLLRAGAINDPAINDLLGEGWQEESLRKVEEWNSKWNGQ